MALDEMTTCIRRFTKHRDVTDDQYKIIEEVQDKVDEILKDYEVKFNV